LILPAFFLFSQKEKTCAKKERVSYAKRKKFKAVATASEQLILLISGCEFYFLSFSLVR
jgi:hypothetical protein